MTKKQLYHQRIYELMQLRYDGIINAAEFLQLNAMAAVESGEITYSKYINELLSTSGEGDKKPKIGGK